MRTLIAAMLLTAIASVTLAEDPKGDLAKVQGKWTAKAGPEKNVPIVLTIKDTSATIHVTIQERELELKGELKLDEAKTPKEWDWTKFTNPQGEPAEDNLAIYKIDGDTLTICSGGPGNPRPTKFEAGEGGQPNLVEFTKVKDDAKKDDLAKLQGKWSGKLGKDKELPLILEIKDKSAVATITMDGQDRTIKGEISLDEAKSPKEWSWTKVKGFDGEDAGDILSIYKIDGDTLTICSSAPGGERPTAFEAGAEGGPTLVTLTRVKDEKK